MSGAFCFTAFKRGNLPGCLYSKAGMNIAKKRDKVIFAVKSVLPVRRDKPVLFSGG
jgi:hypothetical protein